MAIGLTTGLLLAAGVGSQIFGAHKQASAAQKAAGQQVASGVEAKRELRAIYDEQRAGMSPYAALGGQALGKLGALSGFPALPQGPNAQFAGAVGRDAQGNPLGPTLTTNGPLNMSDPRTQHLAAGGSMADPEYQRLGNIGTGGGASSYRAPQAPQGGGSFGPSMVTLQSPDGQETQQVPEDQAQHFLQMGARRVG